MEVKSDELVVVEYGQPFKPFEDGLLQDDRSYWLRYYAPYQFFLEDTGLVVPRLTSRGSKHSTSGSLNNLDIIIKYVKIGETDPNIECQVDLGEYHWRRPNLLIGHFLGRRKAQFTDLEHNIPDSYGWSPDFKPVFYTDAFPLNRQRRAEPLPRIMEGKPINYVDQYYESLDSDRVGNLTLTFSRLEVAAAA